MKSFGKLNGRLLGKSILCSTLAPLLIGLLASSAHADSTVTVAGTTDIFLAGQPNGSSVTGYFGSDTAPANSPVGLTLTGSPLTFSIAGFVSTSVDDSCFDTTADAGACYSDELSFSPGPANGISLADLPAGALVGVFVGPGGPSGPAPANLNFTGAGGIGTAFASLSPDLDQLFFIGDGLTGTGTGDIQQFFAPVGATTLYLAVSDSVGSSTGNLGSITVSVAGANAITSPVPEPGTISLLGLGLTGLIGVAKRKFNR
jgi:hypothetical protein